MKTLKTLVLVLSCVLALVLLTRPVSANLGTVTAGSISGVTATFGGGTVVLNSSGITITAGTAAANQIKFSDGSVIQSNADDFVLQSDNGITLSPQGANGVQVNYLAGLGTGRFVCHNNVGQLYDSATTCDGSAPEALTLAARLVALEAEVARLSALLEMR